MQMWSALNLIYTLDLEVAKNVLQHMSMFCEFRLLRKLQTLAKPQQKRIVRALLYCCTDDGALAATVGNLVDIDCHENNVLELITVFNMRV